MADTPKTVAEALQEAIRSCDVKRDHNYRMGADSFTITTAEYAALRALSTQVAQRDEARELLRDSLPFLRAAHFIYFAAPRDRLVAKINAFLQREGAQNAEGQMARLPQTASSAREAGESAGSNAGTQTAPAPSAPVSSKKEQPTSRTDEPGTPPVTFEQWCVSYNLAQNTASRAAWRDARASIRWELAAAQSAIERTPDDEALLLHAVLNQARETLFVSIKGTPEDLQRSLGKLNLACKAHWDWRTERIRALASTTKQEAKMDERTEGWGSLDNDRSGKAHYFSNGRSLCGKWLTFGTPRWETKQDLGASPLHGDCKGCWKKAAKRAALDGTTKEKP